MSHILFLYLTIIFYGIRSFANYEFSIKSHDACNNDLCSFKSNTQSDETEYSESSLKKDQFNVVNDSKHFNESEIYFVAVSEEYSDIMKDDFARKYEKSQTAKDFKFQLFLETTEEDNILTNSIKELSNLSNITEVSEITALDLLSSTTEPNFSEMTSTSISKLSTSTAQSPVIASHFFLSQSYRKKVKICFCDIEVNKCDINCCCDKDCSPSHFDVFTKCSDENVMLDKRYCYKNNFIFGNGTSQDKMFSKEGLFCIVKENLNHDLIYENKATLKTLEAFNKSLPKNYYAFKSKSPEKLNLNKDYIYGSPIWSVLKGELVPFKILQSSVGFLCNSEINIRYLIDQLKTCFYQPHPKSECKGSKIKDVLQYLKDIKVISRPNFFNKSQSFKSTEICKANECIGITSYFCQSIDNTVDCEEISENFNEYSQASCWNALSHIQYQILHNGSKGIIKMEAYLWIKKLPKISNEFLSQLTTEVKYLWLGFPKKVYKISGAPGYITGKPIISGKKIYKMVNNTSIKKEAIELSYNPKDWLSVLGSEKGICSSEKRIPVNFKENCQNMCSLKLGKSNFTKEKCTELQINIFKLLIGNDIINETKENFFNKFVATFGNSKVEETGDWVQVLIDLFPIMSSQVSFKSSHYHLTCKNIITDLYIDIVHSKIGSFLTPQAKILGVSFRFGKLIDLSYYCDTPGCKNTSYVQYFKLSSAVHFIDISKPAIDAFAEPLSLEAKLPYDFFYPFFSKSSKNQIFNKMILLLFCVKFFYYFEFHRIIRI